MGVVDRLRGVGKVAAFVLFQLLLLAGLLWVLNQVGTGADERAQQATEIAALQAGLDEANALLVEHGTPPVAVPEVEPGEPTIVPLLPTDVQIQQVIVECFADGRCAAPAGKPGADAAPLTNEQIQAAAQACFASGACFVEPGQDGRDGVDGTNGADGQDGAPGADAAPVTPEAIMAAVVELCATGACTGPRGEPGPICLDGWGATEMEVLARSKDGMTPEWTLIAPCTPTEGG